MHNEWDFYFKTRLSANFPSTTFPCTYIHQVLALAVTTNVCFSVLYLPASLLLLLGVSRRRAKLMIPYMFVSVIGMVANVIEVILACGRSLFSPASFFNFFNVMYAMGAFWWCVVGTCVCRNVRLHYIAVVDERNKTVVGNVRPSLPCLDRGNVVLGAVADWESEPPRLDQGNVAVGAVVDGEPEPPWIPPDYDPPPLYIPPEYDPPPPYIPPDDETPPPYDSLVQINQAFER